MSVKGDELAVPNLADSEVVNVVRRLVLQGSLTDAVAEQTGARALLTTDARLTRAPNLGCPVELV